MCLPAAWHFRWKDSLPGNRIPGQVESTVPSDCRQDDHPGRAASGELASRLGRQIRRVLAMLRELQGAALQEQSGACRRVRNLLSCYDRRSPDGHVPGAHLRKVRKTVEVSAGSDIRTSTNLFDDLFGL